MLVVDDDPVQLKMLQKIIEKAGYQVMTSDSAAEALDMLAEKEFNVIISDYKMPEMNGFEVAKAIRHHDPKVGILMLTARSSEDDRLLGFDLGVDDYIAKPFHLKELLARIRRMTERATLYQSSYGQPSNRKLSVGDLHLDCEQLSLKKGNLVHQVTKLEADFLSELMKNPGRVISREHLLEKVWGLRSTTETRTIDNFVVRLRKMIEKDPKAPRILISVRGKGYKLEDQAT